MLTPVRLRDLLVEPASHPRGQPHLSAASGLVRVGESLYLVADDEHHVASLRIDADPAARATLHRILAGELPPEKNERKRRKPDLEALAFLPPAGHHAHGALLALGSGSRPNRQRAVLIGLDGSGVRPGDAALVDLAELYRPPGADRVRLFDLGNEGGVPFGFTDAAALPGGGWLFSAVAEDTGDSYYDGACAASAIGWVSADGEVARLERLAGAPKVEGIALGDNGRLLMVTDSDDPATPSALLTVELA